SRLQFFLPTGEYVFDPLALGKLVAAEPMNVFPVEAGVEWTLPMENRSSEELSVAVKMQIRDMLSRDVEVEGPTVKVPPQSSIDARIAIPKGRLGLGFFELVVRLSYGKRSQHAKTQFVRIVPHGREIVRDSIFKFQRELGGKSGATQALWGRMEPEPGVYKWKFLDDQYESLKKRGLHAGYCCVWYLPNWMVKDPEFIKQHGHYGYLYGWSHIPDDFRLYAGFAAKVVERHKDNVKVYNMWNEPEFFWGSTPTEYMRMLKTAYIAMKQKDPRAEIMIGGSTGRGAFLERAYNSIDGAKHYFDVVQIHYMSVTTPETIKDV
ncbi:MAG: beta-galactosidase, partial [Phycisphaerae bacterium]|nr:beta-galactosidase [Phycisphaerae bacterium]